MLTDLFGLVLLIVLTPGACYLLVLTLAALSRPVADTSDAKAGTLARIAIVVPAHNEASDIAQTLRGLRTACAEDYATRIVVLADNCTDETAAIAAREQVRVLTRHDPSRRGKGPALAHAFGQLSEFDWYVVIDADSRVDAGFLPAVRSAIDAGAQALQCRYLGAFESAASNARRAAFAQIAWFGWNLLRPRGRARLGLSAGILGNGFAVSRATLQRVPYESTSIVEDVDYHIRLIAAGVRVQWVEQATVRAPAAPSRAAATAQRARWTGGRLALLRSAWLPALRGAIRGQWRMLDVVLDLLLPPLSWLVAASMLLMAWPTPVVALGAAAILAVVAFHVAVAMAAGGATRRHWLALLRLPGYLLWSLAALPLTLVLSRREAAWVRTARDASPGDIE